MDAYATIIRMANRFEAIAAEGAADAPYSDDLEALAGEVRALPALVAGVATALTIMIDAIEDSDPKRRFAAKVGILREAVDLLAQSPESRA